MKKLGRQELIGLNGFILVLFIAAISFCVFTFGNSVTAIGNRDIFGTYLEKQRVLDSISSDIFQIQFDLVQTINKYSYDNIESAGKDMDDRWDWVKESNDSIKSSLDEYAKQTLTDKEKLNLDGLRNLMKDFVSSQENIKQLISERKADMTTVLFAYQDTELVVQKLNFSLKDLEYDWISNQDNLDEAQLEKERTKDSLARGVLSLLFAPFMLIEFLMMNAISKAARREEPHPWPADI